MLQKFIKLYCYQADYAITVISGLRGEKTAVITSGQCPSIAISEIHLALPAY